MKEDVIIRHSVIECEIQGTHQITQDVICIIASLRATKKTCSGFPFSFSLPMVTPSTTLNMTRPSTFVPWVHSDPISQLAGWAVEQKWNNRILVISFGGAVRVD